MEQLSLFPDTNQPKQILLFRNFIDASEEAALIRRFENLHWEQIKMHGVIAKRRVVHFGLGYTYSTRSIHEIAPAPKWLENIKERGSKLIHRPADEIKEILITHYPADSGIGWHRDAEVFGDAIVGVSFLSDCTMKFKNPDNNNIFKLSIPRRSAYVFSDEARWKWYHSITSHREDRYSITFRTLKSV